MSRKKPIPRRPGGSSRSHGSPRTQNESSKPVLRISGPQLIRALRGGQPGNHNAAKTLEWLDSYDLSTPAGLDLFMQEVVRRVWCGDLGTRAASSINGTLRLLLEHMTLPSLERRISELEKVKSS
jgi:hypothetical protein